MVITRCTPVVSSWVAFVALGDDQLIVQFRNGDAAFFPGTDPTFLDVLILSGSPGRFVNRILRNWPYRKIAPPCPQPGGVGTNCCVNNLPVSLALTITNKAGNCACGNLPDSDTLIWNESLSLWEATFVPGCADCPGGQYVDLACTGVDCSGFGLIAGMVAPDAGCTCDPLYLVFQVDDGMGNSYTATITE